MSLVGPCLWGLVCVLCSIFSSLSVLFAPITAYYCEYRETLDVGRLVALLWDPARALWRLVEWLTACQSCDTNENHQSRSCVITSHCSLCWTREREREEEGEGGRGRGRERERLLIIHESKLYWPNVFELKWHERKRERNTLHFPPLRYTHIG